MNAAAGVVDAIAAREVLRGMRSEFNSQRAFFIVSALIFVASSAVTITWCMSMSAMGDMDMHGGWTMSMAWMRMPGQTWAGATASFLGMWMTMMIAMMLPTLVPMLWRYRDAVRMTGQTRLGLPTALAGAGYFFVWALSGIVVFAVGVALSDVLMHEPRLARAVPTVAGMVVLIAGALQFTAWKARRLACCREAPGCVCMRSPGAGEAWRHGLRLGLRCSYCCAGMTATLLVIGVMDVRAMLAVTAATTVERLAPVNWRAAHVVGATFAATGLILLAMAVVRARA